MVGRRLSLLLLAVAVAGCSGASHQTKAGVGVARSLSLTMQTPDGEDLDAAFFAAEVARRTHGRIRIVIDGDTYTSADPDNELRLVRALRSGKASLAYIPSRAWERDGLDSFRGLQAPFLIANYGLLQQAVSGSIGARMLGTLSRFGLVGLALVPKELRRPLGRRPLTSAAAFAGARIRVVTSPTSVLDLRALGAIPLTHFDAQETLKALSDHRLDGVESEAHSILSNGYTAPAPYLTTNLVLFAKAQTIVITHHAFDGLTAADRRALRDAATATVKQARPAAQERQELLQLCTQGLRLVQASAADRRALRQAAARAYASIDSDSVARATVEAIRRLAPSFPGTSATATSCPKAQPPAPTAAAPFPQGRYESRVLPGDFAKAHSKIDPAFPVPWVIVIRDGRWHTNESPPFRGTYTVHGNRITFLILSPPENHGIAETVSWSFYRNELNLKVVSVADSGSRVIYASHPWRRIGS
jgi:TRAP-type C4-dicarboxylate transport system substrate-binding protein